MRTGLLALALLALSSCKQGETECPSMECSAASAEEKLSSPKRPPRTPADAAPSPDARPASWGGLDSKVPEPAGLESCRGDKDCVLVPFYRCGHEGQRAINRRFREEYLAGPQWQRPTKSYPGQLGRPVCIPLGHAEVAKCKKGRCVLVYPKQQQLPTVIVKTASMTGDLGNLEKASIRRYIRRKLPRIRNCYEKELLVKQNLKGTVVTQFQISPQGAVLNASAKGVDPKISSCVASAIKSMRFPKPKGLVDVRYSFSFQRKLR